MKSPKNTLPATATPEPRPGPLRGDTRLPLQTRQAQLLFKGRSGGERRPPIVGLLVFAKQVHDIEMNVLKDDPFADWWLLKIESALSEAREVLNGTRVQLQAQVAASPFTVAPVTSAEPLQLPLTFSSRLAFRGAALLAEFDQTVVAVLTAGHLGLMTPEEEQRTINRAGTAVRRAFGTPLTYKALGVTRADLQADTETARAAIARMGTPPDGVLNGSQQAQFGPRKTLRLKRAPEATVIQTS